MKRETVMVATVVIMLCCVGILAVFSASPRYTNLTGAKHKQAFQSEQAVGSETVQTDREASEQARVMDRRVNRDIFHYLSRQATFVGLGLLLMFIGARADYHMLGNRLVLSGLVLGTLGLLAAVLVIGVEVNEARRWIQLPGMTLQPSELAKLTVIVLLAVKLSENQDDIRSFRRGFLPPISMAVLFTGLVVLERDLSTPTIILAVAMLMIVMAGARWWHLGLSMIPAVGAFIYLCVTSPYRLERIYAFHDPWKYPSKEGFQLIQSLAGFARGSVTGLGLGGGEQKLYYLPEANTDFIFSVWGEEMGLMGTLFLVAAFMFLLIVGMRIAVCARDLLGSLLAAGVITLISLQAAVNMCVTTGLVPTTGLPLPFISSGGSAIVINLAMIGILLSVGRQAVEPDTSGGFPAAT